MASCAHQCCLIDASFWPHVHIQIDACDPITFFHPLAYVDLLGTFRCDPYFLALPYDDNFWEVIPLQDKLNMVSLIKMATLVQQYSLNKHVHICCNVQSISYSWIGLTPLILCTILQWNRCSEMLFCLHMASPGRYNKYDIIEICLAHSLPAVALCYDNHFSWLFW